MKHVKTLKTSLRFFVPLLSRNSPEIKSSKDWYKDRIAFGVKARARVT